MAQVKKRKKRKKKKMTFEMAIEQGKKALIKSMNKCMTREWMEKHGMWPEKYEDEAK